MQKGEHCDQLTAPAFCVWFLMITCNQLYVLIKLFVKLYVFYRFRKTQRKEEGQLICRKKSNPDITSSQCLLHIESVQ